MRKKYFRWLLFLMGAFCLFFIIYINKKFSESLSNGSAAEYDFSVNGANIPYSSTSTYGSSNYYIEEAGGGNNSNYGGFSNFSSGGFSQGSIFKGDKSISYQENQNDEYIAVSSQGTTSSELIGMNSSGAFNISFPLKVKKNEDEDKNDSKKEVANKSIFKSKNFMTSNSDVPVMAPPTDPDAEVPLDDYFPLIILACLVVGVIKLKKLYSINVA